MKYCLKCHVAKPLRAFRYISRLASPDGRSKTCKRCLRTRKPLAKLQAMQQDTFTLQQFQRAMHYRPFKAQSLLSQFLKMRKVEWVGDCYYQRV